jgi:Zn-dependent protease with chaperone function
MISIHGKWFNGQSSAKTDVILRVHTSGAWQLVRADNEEIVIHRIDFKPEISARLGNTPRYIKFAGDDSFETLDNDNVDEVLAMLKRGHWSLWVHMLESRMRYVLVALVLVSAFAFFGVKYGVPAAAKIISTRLPESIHTKAGEQVLAVFDKVIFKPSELTPEKELLLRNHLQPVLNAHPDLKLKIELRKGGSIGPNAFALPSGHIIFTDEIVALAEHDDEILTVLIHEIGHVVYHHGMRRLIQDSLLSFIFMAVTGDASGISEIFLGLPVVLTELAYSREFEKEADRYSLDYLQANHIAPSRFADILRRINTVDKARNKTKNSDGTTGWSSYLSTHPNIDERIKLFSGA